MILFYGNRRLSYGNSKIISTVNSIVYDILNYTPDVMPKYEQYHDITVDITVDREKISYNNHRYSYSWANEKIWKYREDFNIVETPNTECLEDAIFELLISQIENRLIYKASVTKNKDLWNFKFDLLNKLEIKDKSVQVEYISGARNSMKISVKYKNMNYKNSMQNLDQLNQ